MRGFRHWSLSLVSAGALGVLILSFFISFDRFNRDYYASKSSLIAQALIQNIQSEIEVHIRVLNTHGKHEIQNIRAPNFEFEAFAKNLTEVFPDIFSVNYVDTEGVIRKVYPQTPNLAALDKNLLRRSDVKGYLEQSLTNKTATLSHRLLTYQGIYGYTLYVPIYDDSGQFMGWLNAVFNFDEWIKSYVTEKKWPDARIYIQWINNDNHTFDQGPRLAELQFKQDFNLLNQKIAFQIGFAPSAQDKKRQDYSQYIILIGIAITGLLMVMTYQKSKRKDELEQKNQELRTSNALISSLTHDIANPVSTLTLTLSKYLTSTQGLSDRDKNRISGALKTVTEMLETGRDLHSLRLNKSSIALETVDLSEATSKAVDLVEDLANRKHIKFIISFQPNEYYGLSEKKTLVNNVLANILNNAIKFSPQGGTIRIKASSDIRHYKIIVEDEGAGFDESLLKPDMPLQLGQMGTDGEISHGFGLLQVNYFMGLYGGDFRLENISNGKGTRATLSFQKNI